MKRNGWSLPLVATLLSASVMIFEISLTRFFSVMFEYHYSFLVISLAVLGLGLGGLAASAAGPLRTGEDNPGGDAPDGPMLRLERFALGAGLSVLAALLSLLLVPAFRALLFAVPATLVPLFFAGMTLASIFRLRPERSALLYAADLSGAAAGALSAVPLLELGAVNAVLVAGTLMLLSAAVIASPGDEGGRGRALRFGRFGFPAAAVALVIFNATTGFLGDVPFSRAAFKEMANMMSGSSGRTKILATRWSSFGRTDLVKGDGRSGELAFFVDGTAGSVMYRFDGNPGSLPLHELAGFSGSFPLQVIPPDEKRTMLAIGPGGGRDVLVGLIGGVKEITAVEVNRDLVDLMRQYSVYNGGLYNGYPGVKVAAEEGRRFVRSDRGRYDVIMMSIPVTKTSRSPDGFALTESFLFTVESFEEYIDRLAPRGRLVVVVHDAREIFRLTFTALEVLRRKGVNAQEAMRHIYTVGPDMFPVFVFSREPLSPGESRIIHETMHRRGYSSRASFIPHIEQERTRTPLENGFIGMQAMLNETLYGIATGNADPDTLLEGANLDLRPATDDRPFFYFFDRELPREVNSLVVFSLFALALGWAVGRKSAPEGNGGPGAAPAGTVPFLLLFTSLGAGFMLIEIPLMQKFMLFLGQPAYAMAVLLASLLAGAAAGSWAVRRLKDRSARAAGLASASGIVVILITAALSFLDRIFGAFPDQTIGGRAVLSIAMLLPLGFVLGMPFPLGLRLLADAGLAGRVPRMWGVNGIASVAGSALSIAISMTVGLRAAAGSGAVFYLVAMILAIRWMRIGAGYATARRIPSERAIPS